MREQAQPRHLLCIVSIFSGYPLKKIFLERMTDRNIICHCVVVESVSYNWLQSASDMLERVRMASTIFGTLSIVQYPIGEIL